MRYLFLYTNLSIFCFHGHKGTVQSYDYIFITTASLLTGIINVEIKI